MRQAQEPTGSGFAGRVALRPPVPVRGPRRGQIACDEKAAAKTSQAGGVVLHLRARYVSKAAIFTQPVHSYRLEIEVPLEFQGLESLGAACGDGFSLANLTAKKSVPWQPKIHPFQESQGVTRRLCLSSRVTKKPSMR
ncbi:hypothetical protein [Rhodopseudomonas rhenobacensis]|uniref:hypothetical protein n=1 Tax=Rhodopseudomonas rhenobacensis TaxID=87461 RepID=UPI0016147992|nr:hypothetical protein [Rhodopseudomonas rhenobacensis]